MGHDFILQEKPRQGSRKYISIDIPYWGFSCGSDGKESAFNARDSSWIPGFGRSPGEGNGNQIQYSCLENPHGQGSLVNYSPWDHKESNMTEKLSTAQHREILMIKHSLK